MVWKEWAILYFGELLVASSVSVADILQKNHSSSPKCEEFGSSLRISGRGKCFAPPEQGMGAAVPDDEAQSGF